MHLPQKTMPKSPLMHPQFGPNSALRKRDGGAYHFLEGWVKVFMLLLDSRSQEGTPAVGAGKDMLACKLQN